MVSSDTVLLMQDTHAPLPLPTKTSKLHFTSFAAIVNAYYACSNAYDFLYMRLSEDGCNHPTYGRRHPSYCKLPAIGVALRKWRVVIFIDSDSWFVPHAPSIDAVIAESRGLRDLSDDGSRRGGAASTQDSSRSPSLTLAWDLPYSNGPNCGFMVWRNSTRARTMLSTWWHLDAGVYAAQHDYEQRAMHWAVVHLERYRHAIETIRVAPLALDAASSGSPLIHVDHTRNRDRYWRLGLAVLDIATHMGMNDKPFASSLSSMQNRTSARLKTAEHLLVNDDPYRVHATGTLRRSLLRAALTTARLLMRRSRCSSPSDTEASSRLFSECVRSRAFNATRAGLRWLSPRSILAKFTESTTISDERVNPVFMANENALAHIEGVPLVLRRCSHALSPWQLWQKVERRDTGNSSSIQLASSSGMWGRELCARVGPGRATREPFLPLAQLGRCRSSKQAMVAGDGDSSVAFVRAQLRWLQSGVSGEWGSNTASRVVGARGGTLQTISLGELQWHRLLGGLLGTQELWPDAPEAVNRPNPDVFWPGLRSPFERAAEHAAADMMRGESDGAEGHGEDQSAEGAYAAADQMDIMDSATGSDDVLGMIGADANALEGGADVGSQSSASSTRDGAATVHGPRRRILFTEASPVGPNSQASPMSTSTTPASAQQANVGCGRAQMSGGQAIDWNCCHPGGAWEGQCGPSGSGMPFTWRQGWLRCNAPNVTARGNLASSAFNGTLCSQSKFTAWARGGNRSTTQAAAFVAKQERWRALNADPHRLYRPCKSEYRSKGDRGDKLKEDCETWCRAKAAHCRM